MNKPEGIKNLRRYLSLPENDPDNQPKNAPKGVSRIHNRSTEAAQPIISDWVSDLLSKDYLTDTHGHITCFLMEEGNLDSKVDAHAYITAKLAEERIAELRFVQADYVNRLRDVYLTHDSDDPLAEKAIKIRNNLRREISEDIDKRIAELEAGLKGE